MTGLLFLQTPLEEKYSIKKNEDASTRKEFPAQVFNLPDFPIDIVIRIAGNRQTYLVPGSLN